MRNLINAVVWVVLWISVLGLGHEGGVRLNEISPFPDLEQAERTGPWIELINTSPMPVSLEGWAVSFATGWQFDLSEDMICEPNQIVLIVTGNTPSVPDPNQALIIHAGQEPWLPGQSDGCVLTGPDGPVDAVIWGLEPPTLDIDIPVGASVMPVQGFYGQMTSIHTPGDVLIRVPIGDPNQTEPEAWHYRSQISQTPGLPNRLPSAVHMYPSDGSELASDVYCHVEGLSWSPYVTFQFARDAAFTQIELAEDVEEASLWVDSFDPGDWYWRVRGYAAYPNEPGPWSETSRIVRAAYDIETLAANMTKTVNVGQIRKAVNEQMITMYHTVKTTQKVQNKDTTMLCLDGCNMIGRCSWCKDQGPNRYCRHGRMYCTRCSVSMMASTGGLELSQDRITYYLFEEAGPQSHAAATSGHVGDPYKDLGHNVGTYSVDCPLLVSWIYGQPKSASQEIYYHDKIFYDDSPAMDSLVEFIKDGRAVLRHCAWHTTLLTGVARVTENGQTKSWCRVHDTSKPGDVYWVTMASTKAVFNEFTFPPTTGLIIRENELELSMDSDSDGLNDFDEVHRFHTDPYVDDTDGDGVTDKNDMLGYMFYMDGDYSPRNRDIDGDGKPKESDPDNDDPSDTGVWDGCEDQDKDGFYDLAGRETDCFARSDDFDALNPDCFRGKVKMQHIFNLDMPMGGFTLFNDMVETIVIGNAAADSEEYVHDHFWSRLLQAEDTGRYEADGDRTLRGHAMVNLSKDPSTGTYSITTDVDTEPEDFIWDNTFPGGGGTSIPGWNPTIFFFKESDEYGRPTYDLGEAIEMEGGIRLSGEYELYEEMGYGTPMYTLTLSWDIWISPPGD